MLLRVLLPFAVLVAACGGSDPSPRATGTKVAPKSDVEREALIGLDDLREGEARSIAGVEIRAEPPYAAASGTVCRWLTMKSATVESRRLACKDGTSWFYAPDVLAAPVAEK